MSASLVGSEMCIRDRTSAAAESAKPRACPANASARRPRQSTPAWPASSRPDWAPSARQARKSHRTSESG
eukprot:5296824-Alexandrium_andersonii.AAC.1